MSSQTPVISKQSNKPPQIFINCINQQSSQHPAAGFHFQWLSRRTKKCSSLNKAPLHCSSIWNWATKKIFSPSFSTFLNSVSGQLELQHVNSLKSTGQKHSFYLENQLYIKTDLKSSAGSGSSVKPGSCSGLSEQMWVDSLTYWGVRQWKVLLAQGCSLAKVHV